jgi:hypothetical protein
MTESSLIGIDIIDLILGIGDLASLGCCILARPPKAIRAESHKAAESEWIFVCG